ncbi:MAG TPA: hypothetical protein VEV17_08625 [Bryobacteraceae bacterium]|nr:hypothetical protein [Bryobacteraceae bacterium]
MRAIALVFGVLAASSVYGQYVISAHSGVIQDVEGRAYLNDKAVDPKFGQFPDIKEGQQFRTEEGRAEVLLTPGVFLRMGENSSIQMISTQLTDTRVEVLGGSVVVECDQIPKDNSIMLQYRGNTMMLVKHGLYRVDSEPARFRVYDGEAIVKAESGQLTLKSGKETSLEGVLMAANFDKNATDELYNWSSRRAGYLAKANVSSAMSMQGSGGGYGGYGGYGGWAFNPLFGLFTFVPYAGIGYSPFGFDWFSPYTVMYYAPYYGGYGYGGYAGGRPSSGNLGRFSTSTGRGFGSASSGGFSRGGGLSSGGAIGGGGHMGGGAIGGGGGHMGGGAIGGAPSGGGGMSGGGGHAGGGGGHGR